MRLVTLVLVLGACSPTPPVPAVPAPAPPAPPTHVAEPPRPPHPYVDLGAIAVDTPWPERAADLDDTCAASADHVEATIDTILAAPGDAGPEPSAAFDVAAATAAFALGDDAAARLADNGFVVLEATRFDTYADAYSALYAADRPLWVSVDALLHAIWIGHLRLVQHLERHALAPEIVRILDDMRRALAADLADGAGGDAEVVRALDIYLGVARGLLAEDTEAPVTGLDNLATARIAALIERVKAAEGVHELGLLDVTERVDLTLFAPRGHYADTASLGRWYQAAMWLSRIPLDLAPESPRATVAALRLAEIAGLAHIRARLDKLELGWSLVAGEREDLGPAELLTIARSLGIRASDPDATARVHAHLAGWAPRTVNLHATWKPLVPFTTLLGPRSAPDTRAAMAVLHPAVPGQHTLGGLEIAAMLGHDRALAHLAPALARTPALGPALAKARSALAALGDDDSVYASWLETLRALAVAPPDGAALPRFMGSTAFADHRIDSAVVGYAQLRHNHSLFVPEPMVANGCSVPDAYVDPAPEVYAAIAAHARRMAGLLATLMPNDEGLAWLGRVERIAMALERIARHELTGRPLTDPMRRFLAMIVEVKRDFRGYTGPLYEGWYIALHPASDELPLESDEESVARMEHERGQGGLGPYDPVRLVTSITTSFDAGVVSYLGADRPALGVFVVDVGGPPRVVVGPVAMSFEAQVPHDGPRYDDDEVPDLVERAGAAPWRASYVARARTTPARELYHEWFGPGAPLGDGMEDL